MKNLKIFMMKQLMVMIQDSIISLTWAWLPAACYLPNTHFTNQKLFQLTFRAKITLHCVDDWSLEADD